MPEETGCVFARSQTELLSEVRTAADDVVITKLRPGQEIELEAHCVKGAHAARTARLGSPCFCCLGTECAPGSGPARCSWPSIGGRLAEWGVCAGRPTAAPSLDLAPFSRSCLSEPSAPLGSLQAPPNPFLAAGVGQEHAKWSPVATAWYAFMPEVVLLRPVQGQQAQALAGARGAEKRDVFACVCVCGGIRRARSQSFSPPPALCSPPTPPPQKKPTSPRSHSLQPSCRAWSLWGRAARRWWATH